MTALRELSTQGRWGLGIVILIVLLGILVPMVGPYDPIKTAGDTLSPPSLPHPFGTDNLGRDVFTRSFAAARIDIAVSFLGVAIPLLIGTIIGAVLGTTRSGTISALWQIVIEGINSFPFIVLVIGIVAIVGTGLQGLLIALAVTNWARYAKISRARALTLREAEFIQAAEVLGYSRLRILLNHLLPNVYSETLAYGLSDFVMVIVTVAALSYLGMGVRPPTPEWGAMIADGRLFLRRQWWVAMCPGMVLTLTSIGVALLAQAVVARARGEEG